MCGTCGNEGMAKWMTIPGTAYDSVISFMEVIYVSVMCSSVFTSRSNNVHTMHRS